MNHHFNLGSVESIDSDLKVCRKKFMILKLGYSQFAVPLNVVREVIGSIQLTYLPNMPAYFAGIINLRGKIISTVYLKKCLNDLKANEGEIKRQCIVITEIDGSLYGAFVDEVTEVVSIEEKQIDFSTKDEIDNHGLFQGIIKFENQSVAPILNMEKVLRINELKKTA